MSDDTISARFAEAMKKREEKRIAMAEETLHFRRIGIQLPEQETWKTVDEEHSVWTSAVCSALSSGQRTTSQAVMAADDVLKAYRERRTPEGAEKKTDYDPSNDPAYNATPNPSGEGGKFTCRSVGCSRTHNREGVTLCEMCEKING